MKRALLFLLMTSVISPCADELKTNQPSESAVTHVATALDHLTVLEFGEPVTMAATGSAAFQIERHEDKVLIKPLKAGASTDLFVWTASRRFTYELEPPGEVRNMNFAVDNRVPALKAVPETPAKLEEIAEMLLTRAFLGVERVDSSGVKDARDRVNVRIQNIFRSQNTLYIHYSIRNLGERPYRALTPTVQQLFPARPAVSLPALTHTQLGAEMARKLGKTKASAITIANAQIQTEDIGVSQETQGVVAIRQHFEGPAVLELIFGPEGKRRVQATVVL